MLSALCTCAVFGVFAACCRTTQTFVVQLRCLHGMVAKHCFGWLVASLLLAVLQPFLAVHFDTQGLEDEPGIRVRAGMQAVELEPGSADDPTPETTIFVSALAHTELPALLQQGLERLLAAVLLLVPLHIALLLPAQAQGCVRAARVPQLGGAPPPPHPWRRLPPETAPPVPT